MKKILLCCMLLLSAIAEAQIVNIPDANFKALLLGFDYFATNEEGQVIQIDSNGDGEIQIEEAADVWSFSTNELQVTSLEGLEAFVNLRNLEFTLLEIDELDVSMLGNLEKLFCWEVQATTINCSGLQHLNEIKCSFCQNLISVDFSDLPNLKKLDCLYTDLASINLNFPSLEVLNLYGNDLLTELDCSALSNLKELDCQGCSLSELNISNLEYLEKVIFTSEGMLSLTMNSLPSLLNFEANTDGFEADFSGCPLLDNFECETEGPLFLNLRNGNADYSVFSLSFDNTYPAYICIDESEEEYLEEAIMDGALVNSYCSNYPGGDYNTITGVLTFDIDGNGCSGSDSVNTLVKVNINDGTEEGTTFSDLSGEYNFFTQAGSFTITPEFENDWFMATPASAIVNSATIDNTTTTENFCITANGVHPDVEVLIVPVEQAQPGFDAIYKVVYRNNGNQVLSGDVYFVYDDTVLDYVSASPVENNATGGTLGWSYTGLMPFESRHMYVTLNVNGPMETPAVNIDDELVFSASISPTVGDETLANNFVAYNETVVGSFDPNDKTCLEGAAITPEMIGEYLHYNINFENTGTAPATFIVVKDVINPAQFDISTLQVLNASHEMVVRVEGNTVEFRFDAINLGPLEKGNVLFKVKTLNTLQIGDEVSNFADIFFDYNFPITTNDATTSFEVLGTGDFEVDSSVMIYPNPTNGIVNITANSNLTSLQLYDLQGRLLQTTFVDDIEAKQDISNRATGMYLLKVTTDKGSKIERIIKE